MNDKKKITLLQRGDEKALENIILTYTNYVGTKALFGVPEKEVDITLKELEDGAEFEYIVK